MAVQQDYRIGLRNQGKKILLFTPNYDRNKCQNKQYKRCRVELLKGKDDIMSAFGGKNGFKAGR